MHRALSEEIRRGGLEEGQALFNVNSFVSCISSYYYVSHILTNFIAGLAM